MQTDRLHSKKYVNWVKTSLSLCYLKEGIVDFSSEKAQAFHSQVKDSIEKNSPFASKSSCQSCTHERAVRRRTADKKGSTWTMDCPAGVCNAWLEEILPYHNHLPLPTIAWANTDPSLWSLDAWQVAKIFQPAGCGSHSSASDSDCQALLTMMLDCKFFHQFFPNLAMLQQIRVIRNVCMHSKDLEVDDSNVTRWLNSMISLLEEPSLKNLQPCIESVGKIKQLRDNVLDLSLNKELELKALDHKISEVATEVKRVAAESQQFRQEMKAMQNSQDASMLEYTDLRDHFERLDNRVTEMTKNNTSLQQRIPNLNITSKVSDLTTKLHELNQSNKEDLREVTERFHAKIKDIAVKLGELQQQMETGQKRSEDVEVKRIQRHLISLYDTYCQRVPVYPLKPNFKRNVADLFVTPFMLQENTLGRNIGKASRKTKKFDVSKSETVVEGFKDMFCSDERLCKNIYLSGDGGVGKTTICEQMIYLWCKAHSAEKDASTTKPSEGEDILKRFTFLFYVSLKEANRQGSEYDQVERMIASQLQLSDVDVHRLMSEHNCLIILDGLDEWRMPEAESRAKCARFESRSLPKRRHSDSCTYLTTCRPWKLETLTNELEGTIDKLINVVGLSQPSQTKLGEAVVGILNKEYKKNKNFNDFMREIRRQRLQQSLETPLFLMLMLSLWYADTPLGKSQCDIYSNLVEKQLQFAEDVRGLPDDVELVQESAEGQLPTCFDKLRYCKKYNCLLMKLARFAYKCLFGNNLQTALLFDHNQSEFDFLSDKELKLLLHFGLLTQHKIMGEITEEVKSIGFIHKSHQEFFASLYLSTHSSESDIQQLFNDVITDLNVVMEIEQTIIFTSGLKPNIANLLSIYIMQKVSEDKRIQTYRATCELKWEDPNSKLVAKIQEMMLLAAHEAIENGHSEICIRLDDFIVDDLNYSLVRDSFSGLDKTKIKSIYMDSDYAQQMWPNLIRSGCLQKFVIQFYSESSQILEAVDYNRNTLQVLVVYKLSFYEYGRSIEDVFLATNLSTFGIVGVADLPHTQLEQLSTRLTTMTNLRDIRLCLLQCSNHGSSDECTYMLDLSTLTNLTKLQLSSIGATQILVYPDNLKECIITSVTPGAAISALSCLVDAFKLEILECAHLSAHAVDELLTLLPRLLNLSRLTISDVNFSERDDVKFSSVMTKLSSVILHDVTMTDVALRNMVGSLPGQKVQVSLGGWSTMTIKGGCKAGNFIQELRNSHSAIFTADRVEASGDDCEVKHMVFLIK